MRRISYTPYLFLLLFFACVFSTPVSLSTRLRYMAVSSLAPSWQMIQTMKDKIRKISETSQSEAAPPHEELERVQRENHLLRSQIEQVKQWLLSETRMQEQCERLKMLTSSDSPSNDFFKRRTQELFKRLELQMQSLFAHVIFREPASWSSSFWVDVGEQDNERLGKQIVCKNSPVLFGNSIIGVVEYVGKSRSQVRLITDAHLIPAVRALRGQERDLFLYEQLDTLSGILKSRSDLHVQDLQAALSQLAHQLNIGQEDKYLAKGEVFGCSMPLWRSRNPLLKGVGFNYDFADEEGPARDLRTGVPYDSTKKEFLSLLREGDILVTSGLDGIFPAGYRVATVSKVHPLKEGASSYEIQAIATAGNLDQITHVVILPSLDH